MYSKIFHITVFYFIATTSFAAKKINTPVYPDDFPDSTIWRARWNIALFIAKIKWDAEGWPKADLKTK
jgi:hypothetical protein